MNEEEQKLFDEFVATRRAKYSWLRFWLVMGPVTIVIVFFLYMFIRMIWTQS